MPEIFKIFFLIILTITFGLSSSLTWAADSTQIDQLKSQINNHTTQIANLEKEIGQYQQNLNATTKQATTLKNELTTIDTERKKLGTEIKVTENKVSQTNLNLQRLAIEIGDKDESIKNHQAALGESLRKLRATEDDTLVEMLLSQNDLSSFVIDQERFLNLENSINTQIANLRDLKTELADKKTTTETEKKKLIGLNNQLGDQKKIADQNRIQKDKILTQTKSSEVAYQKLLADSKAKKEAFERELFQFESQLKIAIDPSLLPSRGSSVLIWPLDNIFITQGFGITSASGRLYASGSHNGVDFRASIGTPVKATASGIIVGTGDTDVTCAGASYGKWILIKHNNGLSTVYGHLSLIKVAAGQTVTIGDVIGYSGKTGYSTGPHLHLSVFASQGVQVLQKKSTVCQGTYTMPIADPKAYLDPMDYLPTI
jgi:murein DD-endopeptidase MepM/ murein hydrolase activator NlpD